MIQLKGTKGFAAYQTYESIIAFLYTCDKYQHKDFMEEYRKDEFKISHKSIISDFKSLNEDAKKELVLEALQVNILSDQQVVNLLRVHDDSNGRAISNQSIGNYGIAEVMKMALTTCVACSEIESELFF